MSASSSSAQPVGRLAPSPTGRLHLGHARTFLLAYWHARSRGGALRLRMEDLDGPRVVPGANGAILRDLEWLGLDWDGPVLTQSSRLPELTAAVDALVARGLAYPCTCSRGDIRTAQSAPQAGTDEPRYPGTCRDRYTTVDEAEKVSGRAAGIRFRVPPGEITLEDGFVGRFSANVEASVGDFLIARRGGAPAYQLAVVVDDAAQGITEIVRGEDLLSSAARQHLLRNALELPHPRAWHVPLVTDAAGRRLAKRADDLSLEELRARGTDPRSIVAWCAETCGMDAAGCVTAAEVAPAFTMERVPRGAVAVTPEVVEGLLAARG